MFKLLFGTISSILSLNLVIYRSIRLVWSS